MVLVWISIARERAHHPRTYPGVNPEGTSASSAPAPLGAIITALMADPSKSILVVDDDASLCTLISHILEQQGHAVVTCDTGAEAVDLLRKRRFDVLLLDIGLPDMDGMNLNNGA